MPSCGKSSGWRPALPRRHSIARCVDEQASVRLWSRSQPNFALSAAPPFLPSERGCIATEGPLDLATLALTSIRTSILSLADRPQFADGCNSRTGAARGRAPLHGLGPHLADCATWLAPAQLIKPIRPIQTRRSQARAPLLRGCGPSPRLRAAAPARCVIGHCQGGARCKAVTSSGAIEAQKD